MTQTVPATAVLGPGQTGLTIGLRVLNLDGTEYAAFATTGVAETNVAGTYRKAGGVVCPAAGGYIVWGTAVLDLAEATVDEVALRPATAGRTLAVAATGEASANVTMWASGDVPDLDGLDGLDGSLLALEATAQEILLDTGTTLPALLAGAGKTAYSNTITDTGSNPLDGVEVWITSDSGGASTVASTTTDTLGAFTVYLDPGTYYLWLAKGGYNFGNPTTITVS